MPLLCITVAGPLSLNSLQKFRHATALDGTSAVLAKLPEDHNGSLRSARCYIELGWLSSSSGLRLCGPTRAYLAGTGLCAWTIGARLGELGQHEK
jgi:hypothetical protein